MAQTRSSPFMVFRFSVWQRSDASDLHGPFTYKLRTRAIRSSSRHETDKLRNTFLYGLLGVFGNFFIRWQHTFHDPSDIGNG
mmetsp:Transcript_6842/g.23266  ORF Transcript_6842/g.23266 Transcript_6842/m.23266 type:complete len:82 (+) Transcript_6842:760-1005(+)